MEPKTSEYLTRLKITATLLVVMVHSMNLTGYAAYTRFNFLLTFFDIIAAVGVPVFFAVSGYLLFIKDFKWTDNMKKKCRTLLVPFLIWNLFWLLFDLIGSLVLPAYFSSVSLTSFPELLKSFFGTPFDDSPYYVPLWFVRDLFLLNAVAPLIKKAVDRLPVWVTAAAAAACFFLLPYRMWYKFGQSVSFFILGGLLARKKFSFNFSKPAKITAVICAVLVAACAFLPGLDRKSLLWRLPLLLGFTAVCIALSFCDFKKASALLTFSFPVYVLHGKILSVVQILYTKLIAQTTLTVTVGYFLLPLAVISVCIAAAVLLKKLLPSPYRIAIGER